MSIYETTLCLGNAEDVPVVVHYTAHEGCYGFFGTPDDPAFIEIEQVTTAGYVVNLSKPDERALRDEIAEHLDNF